MNDWKKIFEAAKLNAELGITVVELDVELKNRVYPGTSGMLYISHPFVVDMYFKEQNQRYNDMLKHKQQMARQSFENKNWSQFIVLYERPYRILAFSLIKSHLAPEEYWELLSQVWTDSENIYQNKTEWRKYLKAKIPFKEKFMDENELAFLKNLPDEFTVYRGYTKGLNAKGFSWTLSKETALFFARRFTSDSKKMGICEKIIKKSQVFAYKNNREESEIIIFD